MQCSHGFRNTVCLKWSRDLAEVELLHEWMGSPVGKPAGGADRQTAAGPAEERAPGLAAAADNALARAAPPTPPPANGSAVPGGEGQGTNPAVLGEPFLSNPKPAAVVEEGCLGLQPLPEDVKIACGRSSCRQAPDKQLKECKEPSLESPRWKAPPIPISWGGLSGVQGWEAYSCTESKPRSVRSRLAVKSPVPLLQPAAPGPGPLVTVPSVAVSPRALPSAVLAEQGAELTNQPLWVTSILPRRVKQLEVYTDIYEGFLPGDLEDMVRRRQQSADLYTAAPELLFICAQLKYGPVRDAFEEQVGRRFSSFTKLHSAKVLHQIMVDMLPRVAKDFALLNIWSDNCGANVSHHSGYLAWLGERRLGLLKRADGSSKAHIQLGRLSNFYEVDRQGAPALLKQLQGFIEAAEALRACQLRPSGAELGVLHGEPRWSNGGVMPLLCSFPAGGHALATIGLAAPTSWSRHW